MHSIQQTRFFAQNYPQLQGLRSVPLGLCLLAVTIWSNLQHGPARDLTLPILLSLACLLLYILVDQYYNRVYGKVKRLYSHAELLWSGAGMLLALAAFILDSRSLVDISFLGLVFAATFVFSGYWYWRRATVLYATSLVVAAVFVLLSLLPLVGIQDWWDLLGLKHSLIAFSLLFGIFGVLGGIIAHIYFIRSLPASLEEK